MLGIPMSKRSPPKDTIGGGGKQSIRSQVSLGRVERNLINSGQKIPGITTSVAHL